MKVSIEVPGCSRRPLLFIIGVALAGAGCRPQPSQVPNAPKTIEVKRLHGTATVVEPGSELQQKGLLSMRVTSVIGPAPRREVRSCRFAGDNFLYNLTKSSSQERLVDYEVRVEPAYDAPDLLEFAVEVTNQTVQVLNLTASEVRLAIGGGPVPIQIDQFGTAVLVPGESRAYRFSARPWTGPPHDALASLSIYGVPTEYDQAGAAIRRENFSWAFNLAYRELVEREPLSIRIEPMTPGQADACNAAG